MYYLFLFHFIFFLLPFVLQKLLVRYQCMTVGRGGVVWLPLSRIEKERQAGVRGVLLSEHSILFHTILPGSICS